MLFVCTVVQTINIFGQLVVALKTVVIYVLADRSLYSTDCDDNVASLLHKLHTFLKPSNASSTSPSTSHDSETTDSVPDIVHIGKVAQCGCDVKLFTETYVSGFTVMRLHNNIECDICKNA